MGLGPFKAKEMPFLDHLEELRWRILKCMASVFLLSLVCFFFSDPILSLLTHPVANLPQPPKIIFLSPTGMFMVRLWVALACGIVFSLPVIFYQVWAFVVPGLFAKERRYIGLITLFSTTFFLLGAAFSYLIIVPYGLRFLLGLRTPQIEPQLDVGKYIGFVSKIILAFGAVFQLPVFSFFLTKLGIISPRFLRQKRRYALILIFILAALLTPPDVFTQVAMALPLILLYEISILVSVLARKKEGR
jgi:sec-independent protein translocase protein TatC